jgi:hypothetical protein
MLPMTLLNQNMTEAGSAEVGATLPKGVELWKSELKSE